MGSLASVIVVIALLALNGAFVLAEFAVVGAPRAAIERLAQDGHRVALAARLLLHTPKLQDRYIATAQLGITLASLGLGMVGEHGLAGWLALHLALPAVERVIAAHALASIVSVAALTFFHIVLGEMVPKSLALASGERALLRILPFMTVCFWLTAPLVVGLHALGGLVLRAIGIRRDEESGAHFHSAEEIEYVVAESEAGGLLEGTSSRMLREIFDFGDLSAGEVMVPRTQVVGLELGAQPDQMRAALAEHPFTRYPVYDGDLDHIVGVVSVKRMLGLLLRGAPLGREVTSPLPYVPATAPLDTVLEAMRRDHCQMAVVMDEFGGTAGLVTTDDLSAEIVGEIAAGKPGSIEIREDASGRLFVLGTARLEDLAETLDLALESEDVDTVSGLVLMLLNRPPRVGDLVTYHGLTFAVLEVIGHGVGACNVSIGSDLPNPR
ncbi:MAG: HlyC/CorC family transporter [Armatimonadetes bacterium]|nr:HlyC/CorC family transporter [Armatimonadota bacterium]